VNESEEKPAKKKKKNKKKIKKKTCSKEVHHQHEPSSLIQCRDHLTVRKQQLFFACAHTRIFFPSQNLKKNQDERVATSLGRVGLR
jgi:hypothetical protein